MNWKVDQLLPEDDFRPKTADMEKVKHYVNVDPTGCEMHAHERDVMTPTPVNLKPTEKKRSVETMEDVTNFPHQKVVDLAESRPYEEGHYRPASMPTFAGIFPTHIFLARGKSYDWCSCGHSQLNPFCDGQCKWVVTRLRPVVFNVSESGYYKLCNCKMSANAPFCNGTHQHMLKWAQKNHRGYWGFWGVGALWVTFTYWWATFYR